MGRAVAKAPAQLHSPQAPRPSSAPRPVAILVLETWASTVHRAPRLLASPLRSSRSEVWVEPGTLTLQTLLEEA